MEVGVVGGETFKLLSIINILLAARSEQQPELASLMTIILSQQPVQHGAERRNPGSGRNEHGVARGGCKMKLPNGP